VLLFGFALPTFGDDAQPMKSILLVARKNLPDPYFREAVVLVTRSAGLAPVGVIVNRPTDVPLSRVFPDIERLRSRDEKLFFGGPVMPEQLLVVFGEGGRRAGRRHVEMASQDTPAAAPLGRWWLPRLGRALD